MRLIGPSNTQSNRTLVISQRARVVWSCGIARNAFAAAVPASVSVTRAAVQPDAGAAEIGISPASIAATMLFGTRLPRPLGGLAIKYCSCAQSPDRFTTPEE